MLLDPASLPECPGGVLPAGFEPAPLQGSPRLARVVSSGLCDLQTNGFAGVDYNDPHLTPDAFETSLRSMLLSGVTCCLPTVITGTETWQTRCLESLERARERSQLARAMVPGYHLEGPFLNPGDGFRGCHPEAAMEPARWERFERLQRAAGGRIRLITVAPEIDGVLELIPRWVRHGVAVAIGHSAADRDTVVRAADAGARLSTHLGNGVARELPKRDNPILSQLAEDRLCASFIADGFHLEPHVLGVYLRAKQTQRTVLVTDSTAGSAAPPGRYTLGPIALDRAPQGVVYLPGTQDLAGSATTLGACVSNVVRWFSTPLDEAVRWACEQPRELIGLRSTPRPDAPVDWVWWTIGPDGPRVTRVQLGTHIATVR